MGAASWGEFGVPRPELDTPSRQQAEMSAAAAEPLQCSPMDGSPPGSSVPGILQARILERGAISLSNACKQAKSLQSCLTLCDPIDGSPPGSSVHGAL